LLVAGCWLPLQETSCQKPETKENHCAKKSVFVFCATITIGICLAPMWANDLAALLAARDSGGTFAADD